MTWRQRTKRQQPHGGSSRSRRARNEANSASSLSMGDFRPKSAFMPSSLRRAKRFAKARPVAGATWCRIKPSCCGGDQNAELGPNAYLSPSGGRIRDIPQRLLGPEADPSRPAAVEAHDGNPLCQLFRHGGLVHGPGGNNGWGNGGGDGSPNGKPDKDR